MSGAAATAASVRPKDGDGLRASVLLISFLTFANVLLNKIALPGSNGTLSIVLVLMLGTVVVGLLAGCIVVNVRTLPFILAACAILIVCAAFSWAREASIPGLLLVLCFLGPYLVSWRHGQDLVEPSCRAFCNAALLASVAGTVQFAAQFVVGRDLAFFLDVTLPKGVLLSGYNNLNPLHYGSQIIKSNGFFLCEPSILNQMVCLAIVVELCYFARLRYLVLFAAGALVTYSGTGFFILAATLPFMVKRQFVWIGAAVLGAAVLYVSLGLPLPLNLDLFVQRIEEFSSPRSSGYARFISPFRLIETYVLTDPVSALFGRGSGSINEHALAVDYEIFDPTWGKLVYEYGIVGSSAYAVAILAIFWNSSLDWRVKVALAVKFFLLGGLLATPDAHVLIALLVAWPAAARATVRSGVRDTADAGGMPPLSPQGWARSPDGWSRR